MEMWYRERLDAKLEVLVPLGFGGCLGSRGFVALCGRYFVDQLANTATKKISKDNCSFAGRNLPESLGKVKVEHVGLPVCCCRSQS
jgi:hypothetical protein